MKEVDEEEANKESFIDNTGKGTETWQHFEGRNRLKWTLNKQISPN